MKILKLFLFLFFVSQVCNANVDTLNLEKINSKIEILQNKVDEVKRDQLNYAIEKTLLKDTYSNNYDKINLFITGILLLVGILGFVGLRDINSIKKEYKTELDRLNILQEDIKDKSKEFEQSKQKYDKDITDIIKQNEEQNRKLKVLEIKEKLNQLIKERNHEKALEFSKIALEFAPDDIDLLIDTSKLYSRILNYEEAIKTLYHVLELDENNNTAILNLAEIYLFVLNEVKSTKLIQDNQDLFNKKAKGKLLFLFELFRHYINNETVDLKTKILESIDRTDLEVMRNRIIGWDLYDAIVFLSNRPESVERNLLLNYLWYLNGQINAKDVLLRFGEKIDEGSLF